MRVERQIREEIMRATSRKGRVHVTLPNVMKLDKMMSSITFQLFEISRGTTDIFLRWQSKH